MISKCLLWDFDGTLAKRDGMFTRSLVNVMTRNGFNKINEAIISDCFSRGFPWHRYQEPHSNYMKNMDWWDYIHRLVIKALLSLGLEGQDQIDNIIGQFKEEYLKIEAWTLYDDTIINLEYALKSGYSNYILSNHVPELEELVEGLGIRPYFKAIITSAKIGYEKPNIGIFKEISNLGSFDQYFMIGDSYHADVIGALNFGIDAILVRNENIYNYHKYSKDLSCIWRYIE